MLGPRLHAGLVAQIRRWQYPGLISVATHEPKGGCSFLLDSLLPNVGSLDGDMSKVVGKRGRLAGELSVRLAVFLVSFCVRYNISTRTAVSA